VGKKFVLVVVYKMCATQGTLPSNTGLINRHENSFIKIDNQQYATILIYL